MVVATLAAAAVVVLALNRRCISSSNNNTNSVNPESVLEPREEVVNTNSKQTSEIEIK